MEELKEICEAGDPIKLFSDWELLATAKELLHNYNYVEDPEDPNSFFKQVPAISTYNVQPKATSIKFPSYVPDVSYLPPDALVHLDSLSSFDDAEIGWTPCKLIELDTNRLPLEHQVWVTAQIPKQTPKKQPVVIRVQIEPHVKLNANLCVHLQIQQLFVGVPKTYMFQDDISVGYYPSFIRFTLMPLLDDPSEVALPLYTQCYRITDEGVPNRHHTRRTTETKLGASVGWGPITFIAERAWGTEADGKREDDKLVTVIPEDGNAASMEWSVLRWAHNGTKYNAKKPHAGIWPMQSLKPPSIRPLLGIPGIVWHLQPEYAGKNVKFRLHLEVEMHLVWFVGRNVFFRRPGSDSISFEFKREVEVLPD